jgi:hypothetical protein
MRLTSASRRSPRVGFQAAPALETKMTLGRTAATDAAQGVRFLSELQRRFSPPCHPPGEIGWARLGRRFKRRRGSNAELDVRVRR